MVEAWDKRGGFALAPGRRRRTRESDPAAFGGGRRPARADIARW